jgi:hypothetical protein
MSALPHHQEEHRPAEWQQIGSATIAINAEQNDPPCPRPLWKTPYW